jgi:hypothetical protein
MSRELAPTALKCRHSPTRRPMDGRPDRCCSEGTEKSEKEAQAGTIALTASPGKHCSAASGSIATTVDLAGSPDRAPRGNSPPGNIPLVRLWDGPPLQGDDYHTRMDSRNCQRAWIEALPGV